METMDDASYHQLENIFIQGYREARDTMLYLRMAHIPFEIAVDDSPYYLQELRLSEKIIVGHVAPAFGSSMLVHQMLPHELVQPSTTCTFVYVNQSGIKEFSLKELYQIEVRENDSSYSH